MPPEIPCDLLKNTKSGSDIITLEVGMGDRLRIMENTKALIYNHLSYILRKLALENF